MNILNPYPYNGKFFREVNIAMLDKDDFPYPIGDDFLRDMDGNIYQTKPIIMPSAPESEKVRAVDLFFTECDITEASQYASSAFLGSSFVISFPVQDTLKIKRGDFFESDIFGLRVNGEVTAIFPSQLGVKVYLKDIDN